MVALKRRLWKNKFHRIGVTSWRLDPKDFSLFRAKPWQVESVGDISGRILEQFLNNPTPSKWGI